MSETMMLAFKTRLRQSIFYPPIRALSYHWRRFIQWWSEARWYRTMRRFYTQFIQPGDLVFDVGANVGLYTCVILQLGARVVAVEPQKDCARILFAKFHANSNFSLVNKALGTAEGQAAMYVANSSSATSLSPQWIQTAKPKEMDSVTWGAPQPVSVTTLDVLIVKYGRPVFTKIDVEGYEYQVILGLSQPVLALSFEFHPTFLEPALECIQYLERFGTMRLNYTIEWRCKWVLDQWVTPDEMIAILNQTRIHADYVYGDVYVRFAGM